MFWQPTSHPDIRVAERLRMNMTLDRNCSKPLIKIFFLFFTLRAHDQVADHYGAEALGGGFTLELRLYQCSLPLVSVGGWEWGGWGGGGVVRIYREEALDTKVSSMAASTTFLGRLFQSLIVLGRKEELLYCVPAGMSWNCLLWPQCWREGQGMSLDLRLGNGLGHCGFSTTWRAMRCDSISPVQANPMPPACCWCQRCFSICWEQSRQLVTAPLQLYWCSFECGGPRR